MLAASVAVGLGAHAMWWRLAIINSGALLRPAFFGSLLAQLGALGVSIYTARGVFSAWRVLAWLAVGLQALLLFWMSLGLGEALR